VQYRGEANWILELDVQSYFDSIPREMLLEMIREPYIPQVVAVI
jgi:retron-type reverse transcriptase